MVFSRCWSLVPTMGLEIMKSVSKAGKRSSSWRLAMSAAHSGDQIPAEKGDNRRGEEGGKSWKSCLVMWC